MSAVPEQQQIGRSSKVICEEVGMEQTVGFSQTRSLSTDHRLLCDKKGGSSVEQIAERIELRRAERVLVSFKVRVRLLKDCRAIARAKGYEKAHISLIDLKEYQSRVQTEVDDNVGAITGFVKSMGFLTMSETLLDVLERAVEVVDEAEDDWLHYQDFNFYHTHVVSIYPWARSSAGTAAFVVLLYYILTPVFFCYVVHENSVCDGGPSYDGWVSSLYFASTTLSTVGYGDLSVQQDSIWRSFMGSLYMIISVLVAVAAFSGAADTATGPLGDIWDNVINKTIGPPDTTAFLYQRVRRVKLVKLGEILFQFLALNLLGMFVSRIFIVYSGDVADLADPKENWSWMTCFYWAIQTTTTIGYGDLTQPTSMRWFKIFYLALSTYFVGSCLGKLAELKDLIENIRLSDAFFRRKVTKSLINETQGYVHDEKVDQFEFALSSLIMLGKVSSDDVNPIMDKYRELSGNKGFIVIDDVSAECVSDIVHEDELRE